MASESKRNLQVQFFTPRMVEKLDAIAQHAVTTLVAPGGYGKTTALRAYMARVREDCLALWISVYSASQEAFWASLVDVLRTVSSQYADEIAAMGFPSGDLERDDFMRMIHRMMREQPDSRQVMLLIDDYHIVANDAVYDLLCTLVRDMPENLHLVLASRRAVIRLEDLIWLGDRLHCINAQDFALQPEEIAAYFKSFDIDLPAPKCEELYEASDGWISVIYLNLIAYVETGMFVELGSIHQMMGCVLFQPLSAREKKFFTALSVVPAFTHPLARAIWGEDDSRSMLIQAQNNNGFLTYREESGEYRFHQLLLEYIRNLFAELPVEQQNSYRVRAGKWYAEKGDYVAALPYFYAGGDFESLLTAIELDFADNLNAAHQQEMDKWFRDCPDALLAKHHAAMLIYARRLFTFNKRKKCVEVLERMLENVQKDERLSEQERNNYTGEYEILLSFMSYNNIGEMSLHHQRAEQIMSRRSVCLKSTGTWTFGAPSVLHMFHRISGQMEQEVQIIKSAMPHYYSVSGKHGYGSEASMEAEWYFYRGKLREAALLTHQARYRAASEQQWGIHLTAVFLQMRMCALVGNVESIRALADMERERFSAARQYMLLHTLDLCEAFVYAQLNMCDEIPEWIAAGELQNARVLFPAMPMLHMVYGRVLVQQEKFGELISAKDDVLRIMRIYPNLQDELYEHLYLCAGYEFFHKREEAMQQLRIAAAIAEPDDSLIPFVEMSDLLQHLYREAAEAGEMSCFDAVERLMRTLRRERSASSDQAAPETCGLTEAELGVARLAAARLTNREIAERLFVTERTVKFHLNQVFSKLNIDGVKNKRKQLERFF